MDVFESPLEALDFNYVSFGFLATVQSFLTCVAIVTAAISFWRIRTVGSNSFHRTKSSGDNSPPSLDDGRSTLHVSPPPSQASTWSKPEPEPEKEKEKPFHQEQACSALVGVGAIEYDDKHHNSSYRIIKDKFTLYYDDEDATISGEETPIPIHGDGYGFGDGAGTDIVCSYREELYYTNGRWSCDGILVGRGGDLGWYRSQDLTVLNGSVVRLWDCQRRRCLLPSGGIMAL